MDIFSFYLFTDFYGTDNLGDLASIVGARVIIVTQKSLRVSFSPTIREG